MVVFSQNQVRHLYVAKEWKGTPVTSTDNMGAISVSKDKEGDFYIQHVGHGGVTRSDVIKKDKVKWVRFTQYKTLQPKMAKYKIVLDPNVNGGNPVVGEEYMISILFSNYKNAGPMSQMYKYGVAKAFAGMDTEKLIKALAESLQGNFKREGYPMAKITYDTTSITVEETENFWKLGQAQYYRNNIIIEAQPIEVSGTSIQWAKVTKEVPTTTLKNGKIIADMEYFFYNNRTGGAKHHYPQMNESALMVDYTHDFGVIDIGYYQSGEGINSDRSEVVLTIVMDETAKSGLSDEVKNGINPMLPTDKQMT